MKKVSLAVLIGVVFAGGIGVALAQQGGPCEPYCTALIEGVTDQTILNSLKPQNITCICNPLRTTSFTGIIDNILTLIFNFAIVLAPLMAVVAGMMFVTAAGSPTQITRARNILIWTAIGFGVILLARGLVAVLQQVIGI